MGKLVRFCRSRPQRATTVSAEPRAELELFPVAALLFVASLFRVARALWMHEAFDTEPTFALVFVVGLPWLWLRNARRR